MYSLEEIRKAMRLFMYLIENNELRAKDDIELYRLYTEQPVQEIIQAFEEESKVSIKKYDDTIYFIPHTDNEFMGYKRAELKREIFPRSDMKNIDLFLAMYIIIALTSEFYSGKGMTVKIRDLIELGELDQKITERLEPYADSDDTTVDDMSKLAITDIANYWFTLLNEDDAINTRTRRWYVKCVMDFLKKEDLINIQDETVIIPTSKFNRLTANYFLNFDRLDEIQGILSKAGEGGMSDAQA